MNEKVGVLLTKIHSMQIDMNHLIEQLEGVKEELEMGMPKSEIIKGIDLSLKLFGEWKDPNAVVEEIVKNINLSSDRARK